MKNFYLPMIIGVTMSLLGCTSESYTTKELLEAEALSREKAVEIEAIEEKVKAQIDLFAGLFFRYERKEMAATLPKLYAKEAFLNDRIHTVRGSDAIIDYFDTTFKKMHKGEFRVHDTTFAKRDIYIRWTMRIQLKEGDKFMEFLGLSQLRFNQEGMIIYHQDYWDFSELMGELPLIRTLVNYVKGRA